MTDLFKLLDISPKANPIDYLLLLDGSLSRTREALSVCGLAKSGHLLDIMGICG